MPDARSNPFGFMRVRVCRLLQFAWHWPAGRFAFSGPEQGRGEPHSYPFHRVGRRSVSVSANPSGLPLPFRRIAPPSRRPAGLRPFRRCPSPLARFRSTWPEGPISRTRPMVSTTSPLPSPPPGNPIRRPDLPSKAPIMGPPSRPVLPRRTISGRNLKPPTLLPRRPSRFRQTMLNPERPRPPGFRLKARPTDRHPQPTRRSLRTPDFAGHVDTLLACKERFLQTRFANNKRMTF